MLQAPEIKTFLANVDHIFFRSYDQGYREVILTVLRILLEEPNTSSIAVKRGVVITQRPKKGFNDFTLLARIPLWLHSVHVANHFITGPSRYEFNKHTFQIGIITALSHDFGKMMRFRPAYYQSCEHPHIGAKALDSVIDERLVPLYKEFILKAVEAHHRSFPVSDNIYVREIALRVKSADYAARQDELIEARLQVMDLNNSEIF
jgi:hypothetical protein